MRLLSGMAVVAAIGLAGLAWAPAARAERAEPPVAELQRGAQKELAEHYGAAWNETDPEKRRALAYELYREASRGRHSETETYVLFNKAMNLAQSSGDARIALLCLQSMENQWKLADEAPGRTEIVRDALAAARKPEQYRSVVRSGLGSVDTLLSRGDYRDANALVSVLRGGAGRARDRDLLAAVAAKRDQVVQVLSAYRRVEPSFQTLQEKPDDPAANHEVGRFYAFQLDQWERALPYLAKGNEKDLASVAKLDMADPTDAKEQKELGDRHWKLAEQSRGSEAVALRDRARHWYRLALDRLSGSERELVKMRASSPDAINWAGRIYEPGVSVTYRQGEEKKRRVSERLEFDWRTAPPVPSYRTDDRYHVALDGFLRAPSEGRYRLSASSSGSMTLKINDNLVFDGWGGGSFSVWLYKGFNRIELKHYVRTRPERRTLSVQWGEPGADSTDTIPIDAIYHVIGEGD